jgi:hypothetical protein
LLLAIAAPLARGAPEVDRLVLLAGDRQVVVGASQSAAAAEPFVVQAFDSTGEPVTGVSLFFGSAGLSPTLLRDAYGFYGFNVGSPICYTCLDGSEPAGNFAVTDARGIAVWPGDLP